MPRPSNAPLIGALRELGSDAGHDLARRLAACCKRSRLRSHAGSDVEFVEHVAPSCRQIACARCRRSLRRRWHDAAAEAFGGIAGNDCSFVTIHLSRCGTLDDVQAVASKFRTQLRNRRDRVARSSNPAWSGLIVRGLVELDWLESLDAVSNLFAQRRAMLADLPAEGAGASAVWLPHAHLAVAHAGVSRDELRQVLASIWPGAYRVHVKPFHDADGDAAADAANCVSYASKLSCKSRVGDIEAAWPMQVQAEFFSWLYAARRGLDLLRVRLGARRVHAPLAGSRSGFRASIVTDPELPQNPMDASGADRYDLAETGTKLRLAQKAAQRAVEWGEGAGPAFPKLRPPTPLLAHSTKRCEPRTRGREGNSMTGGYNGWKDSDGEWRFTITILPERGEPGRMILGLAPQDGSEAETKGLTEDEFRQLMIEEYGQTAAETDKAVQACKNHGFKSGW